MFEGSGAALSGMVQGLHGRAVNQVVALAADLKQARTIGWQWQRKAEELEARVHELEALRKAEDEALAAVTAEWRREHPVSHMHDLVGKWRDGTGVRRNASIWVSAFDAAARRLGIRNPEAHRIS